jgi:surfactin synthase thioesterase subunit
MRDADGTGSPARTGGGVTVVVRHRDVSPVTAVPPSADLWVRRFHQCPDAAVRLICFPHAGGSATYYFPLSQSLSPAIEVMAVQYPGRQDRRREPFIENIADLADKVAQALVCLAGRPFALFGHSMGAILAFEVAQRLRSLGAPPPLRLFASGRRAPSRRRAGGVHRLDDASLVDELRRVGGTDPRFLTDPEVLAAILPATRNDYKAIETYVWSHCPPLDCPITALIGDSDPQTTVEEASAWAEHATADFTLLVFRGAHFYLDTCKDEVVSAILGGLGAGADC